jgi:hypothetical protein
MHECALETCEPRVAMFFFVPIVHSPPGAMGHVASSELPSQEVRALSRGTRGSTGAHLSKEKRFGAIGHMAASKLTLARRQGSELRDTWRHQSSPQQGGEVRGRETRGGSRAHLCREVWSKATSYVTVRGCTPCSLS